jgi:hypothetical protein
MNSEATLFIKNYALELASFESLRKPKMRSDGQRIKDLERVALAAIDLHTALRDLDLNEGLLLDAFLADTEVEPIDSHQDIGNYARGAAKTILAIRTCADQAVENMKSRGSTGRGRVKTLESYSGFIMGVAMGLKRHNVTPADGGKFRRLCDAIFTAANVPANAQGAIKHFLTGMRPFLKHQGHCL